MHLIVTRPEEDAGPLQARLEAHGHTVTLAPLLRIVARANGDIPSRPYQLAVATSANGIRALASPGQLKSLRILTVGPQSLAAAQSAGFARAEARGGDVAGLAAYITANFVANAGPILYLSGAETSGDLQGTLQASGFTVDRLILYDAVPAATLGPAAAIIAKGEAGGVLLYSPRTARLWAALVEQAGLAAPAAELTHFCLSENVAGALPESYPRAIANSPHEDAMLALLEQSSRTV
jgi:uroporphyrinogen-III synthase